MNYFQQPIAEKVWDIKYRYRHDGKLMEDHIQQTWQRVAQAIASVESPKKRKYWQEQFFHALQSFRFLPGGRILAGAGTRNQVTLFNCFVIPIEEDSLTGIFDALEEGALTLQEGGGIGYDFSVLRYAGALAHHTGSTATGPVSFMRIWDAMSATMQSSGARRGAMMATLRCDHPDIEKFITAKSDPAELRHFNISVVITDEFINAVKNNATWALVFPLQSKAKPDEEIIHRRWSGSREPIPCRVVRYVSAQELWQKIISSAYKYAEPGVLFEDTINQLNPLWYCEWISATNPCGEIPLPAYGACNLGSINLTQFVTNPFSERALIDWQGIEAITAIATRFLDNVIDVSLYPLKQQKTMALATRRIGLGITGLADMLVMLGIRYGSKEAIDLAGKIMKAVSHATWRTSIALAKEKGRFPLFKKKQYLAGEFVKNLPQDICDGIAKYGIRNSHHNTIAPAGTISLLANNISSGIEPVFSAEYERKIRIGDEEITTFRVTDHALHLWRQNTHATALPPAWVDTNELTPEEHLHMQAAMQPYIDNAISKTINLPESFPFEKLNEVYTTAHRLKLKGCTIFRPNPITGSVLSLDVDQCGLNTFKQCT